MKAQTMTRTHPEPSRSAAAAGDRWMLAVRKRIDPGGSWKCRSGLVTGRRLDRQAWRFLASVISFLGSADRRYLHRRESRLPAMKPVTSSRPITAVLAMLFVLAGCRESHRPPFANPVQAEMRVLTEILELTVRSVGARDVRPIEHELHRLHAAKEATTAAIRDGSYKLPKNAADVAGFEAMDEAFHTDLEKLVVASRANDVQAAAAALGSLVRACEGCHATFRP